MVTLAEQYYLKALDDYPYDLEQSLENLNYALGYDQEHAGANCLMGRIYFEQLQDYDSAEEYFVEALNCDPTHMKTCESYIRLASWIGEYPKAERLITHALKIKGVDRAHMYGLRASNFELQKEYTEALVWYNRAIDDCFNDEAIRFYEGEITRVENKIERSRRYVYRF